MKVDIYKAKKGFVFVAEGKDPAKHVPDNVGHGKLVRKSHPIIEGATGLPKDISVIGSDIDTNGYYHSSAGLIMSESISISGKLDKNNPPRS